MILLFGSTGYIGSEFKKELIEQNIKFICLENTKKTSFDQLQTLFKHQKNYSCHKRRWIYWQTKC